MATIAILGAATFNTSSGSKTVTATPAANDLIVIVTAHTGNTSGATPTDNNSDGLGVYSTAVNTVKNTSADRMGFHVRNSLVGSATSTVFTHAPGASSGGGLVVLAVAGMPWAGLRAVRQFGAQANQAAATPAPAFPAVAQGVNPLVGAVFNATSPAGMTQPAAFDTEETDVGYSTPTTGLEVVTDDTGNVGQVQTWGSASASAFCSLIMELSTVSSFLWDPLMRPRPLRLR